MSNYFSHLATRIAHPTLGVRPRLGSRFEPRQGTGALAAHSLAISGRDEVPSGQQENDWLSVSQPAVEPLLPPTPSSPVPMVAESPIHTPSNGVELSTECVRSEAVAEMRSHPTSPAPFLNPEGPTSPTATVPTPIPSNPEVPSARQPLSSRHPFPNSQHRPNVPVDALPDLRSKPTESMAIEPLLSGSDITLTSMNDRTSLINANSLPTTLQASHHSVSPSLNKQKTPLKEGSSPQPSMAQPTPGRLNASVTWTSDTSPDRGSPHRSLEQVSNAPFVNHLTPTAEIPFTLQSAVGEIAPKNNRPTAPSHPPNITEPSIAQQNNLGNESHHPVLLPTGFQPPMPQTRVSTLDGQSEREAPRLPMTSFRLNPNSPHTPVLQPAATDHAATDHIGHRQSARLAISPRPVYRSPLQATPMGHSMGADAAPTPVNPTVNVSIGRIEVRMTSPQKPQRVRASRPATGANVTSLSNYLRQGGQS